MCLSAENLRNLVSGARREVKGGERGSKRSKVAVPRPPYLSCEGQLVRNATAGLIPSTSASAAFLAEWNV